MYKKIHVFGLLKKLDIQKNYQLYVILKEIILSQKKVKIQLNCLLAYKIEYTERLMKELSLSVSGSKLIFFDNFIAFLTNKIKQQEVIMKKYVSEYKKYLLLWKKTQNKINIWKKIISMWEYEKYKNFELEEQNTINFLYVQKKFTKN